MKKKRFWPSLLKRTAVWTLIAGIISGGFGGGVYLIYQDSLKDIENNACKYVDEVNILYLLNRGTNPIYGELLKEMDLEYDYSYFGEVNEDGSLTDIYETSYDDFDVWLKSNKHEYISHYRRIYSYDDNIYYPGIETSDKSDTKGHKLYYRYRLTHDASKAGKTERENCSELGSDFIFMTEENGKLIRDGLKSNTKNESDSINNGDDVFVTDPVSLDVLPSYSPTLETRYLLCSDDVYNVIRSSGQRADKKNVRTMLCNNLAGRYTIPQKTVYDSFLRNENSPGAISTWKEIVSALSPYLFDFRTGSDEDQSNKHIISLNCSVDDEQGRIGVSSIDVNGKQTKINDNGLGAFDDRAELDQVNIERPDSILEKYGNVFKPSKFNEDELPDFQIFDQLTYINNAVLEHVDQVNGIDRTAYISVEGLRNDYQPYVFHKTTERRYEDGHVILAGFMQCDRSLYRYAYTIPFAGFWESAGTDILGAALKIWLCGFVILLIITLISYERYLISFRQAQFKDGLIDAVAHNMKTPMQVISVNAENLYEPASEEARKANIDSILAETRDVSDMVGKILSLAEKGAQKSKFNVRKSVEETAEKACVKAYISGDAKIKADKEFFEQALFNLLDNAGKYKPEDSEITVRIDRRKMLIENSCKEDKFTPGAGIAIADRYLSQTGMSLKQRIKDGRFISEIRF